MIRLFDYLVWLLSLCSFISLLWLSYEQFVQPDLAFWYLLTGYFLGVGATWAGFRKRDRYEEDLMIREFLEYDR